MKHKILALTASLAVATSASAAVTYDANGVGFVGNGDIQTLYGWNNAGLNANADLVMFRLLSDGSVTWTCTGVNPAGHTVTQSHSLETQPLDASVDFSVRRNPQGNVTGFELHGTEGGAALGTTEYTSIGSCNTLRNWQVQPTLDPYSINMNGGGPMLQVSIDGEEWFDLPVTE
jgi:hypothetical protein